MWPHRAASKSTQRAQTKTQWNRVSGTGTGHAVSRGMKTLTIAIVMLLPVGATAQTCEGTEGGALQTLTATLDDVIAAPLSCEESTAFARASEQRNVDHWRSSIAAL